MRNTNNILAAALALTIPAAVPAQCIPLAVEHWDRSCFQGAYEEPFGPRSEAGADGAVTSAPSGDWLPDLVWPQPGLGLGDLGLWTAPGTPDEEGGGSVKGSTRDS